MPIDVALAVARTPRPCDPLKITMPCGGELIADLPGIPIPDGRALAQAVINKANAAMTPLMPIFKIVDAVLAVFDMLKAIPTMDVPKLVEALEKLAGVVTMLTKLIPPLSVPLLALQFIDALIAYLQGLVTTLRQLVLAVDRIDAMRRESARYPSLLIVVDAEEYNLDATMESLEKGSGGMNTIIRLVNTIMGLAGLPTLPELGSLGRDPAAAIAPLEDTLREVQHIRSLIPF